MIAPPITLRLKGQDLGRVMAAKLSMAKRQTGELQDYLANKACNYISLRAWQTMPKVSPYAIDQELEVSSHGITAKGKLSKAKKPRKISIGSHPSSLASRIVLASFYGDSKFNITTGQVFKRDKPNTHGQDEFWQWIAATVARMTKARHSSAGFFAVVARAVNVGFGIALGRFRPAGPGDPRISAGGQNVNQVSTLLARGLAQVYPATGGTGVARFTVATTEPDTKGRKGAALEKIVRPVWQKAIDDEVESIRKEIKLRYRAAMEASGFKMN